jgi:Zn finger protein HypA/HybF involved in hydrogenase expression
VIVDKEEFRNLIISGKTIKELQEHYNCSRSSITEYKKKFNFVGLSPNSKKINRESGLKICNSCDEEKSLEEFSTNGYTPLGKVKYKAKCKKCSQQDSYDRFNSLLEEYLDVSNRKYACEQCGYTNVFGSLDWHHLDPETKDFNISDVSRTISSENFAINVIPELDKCAILCPNCHRLEHIFMGRK